MAYRIQALRLDGSWFNLAENLAESDIDPCIEQYKKTFPSDQLRVIGMKPKTWKSTNVCPECASRCTKLFNMNSGKYICQICDHEYDGPLPFAVRFALGG